MNNADFAILIGKGLLYNEKKSNYRFKRKEVNHPSKPHDPHTHRSFLLLFMGQRHTCHQDRLLRAER